MMVDFQTIFNGLNPYRVASDLQLDIKQSPGLACCQINHPKEGHPLVITPTGFVALDPVIGFAAGDSFDFLASCLGGYPQAVTHVLAHYSHVAENSQGLDLTALSGHFSDALELRRLPFSRISQLREHLAETPHRYSEVVGWLHSQGVETEAALTMVYAARGDQLQQLLDHPAFPAEKLQFEPTEQYAVLPYFRDYHVLGTVEFRNVVRDSIQTMELNGGSGFFGLAGCPPEQGTQQVFNDVSTCLEARGQLFRRGITDVGTTTIPLGFFIGDRPRHGHGTYILDEPVDLNRMMQCRQCFDRFHVSASGLMGLNLNRIPALSWHDYLRHHLSELRHVDGNGHRFFAALDIIKPDRDACQHLIEWFTAQNQTQLLARIKTRLNSKRQYQFDKAEITENAYGYTIRKSSRDPAMPFTNFTVNIDQNVFFHDTNELFHRGQLVMAGKEFQACFSAKALERPALIEEAAIASVLKQGGKVLPRVTDPALRKRLAQVIRQQTGNAHNLSGVRRLGMDKARQRFVTPTWQATALGVEKLIQSPYPGSDLFSYYSFQVHGLTPQYDRITSKSREFIAIWAALLGRAWAGHKAPVITVSRSESARLLLHALFLSIGQSKPFPVAVGVKGQPEYPFSNETRDYPVFGTCLADVAPAGNVSPLMVLAHSGLSYQETLDESGYNQIYSFAHHIATLLIVGLMRNHPAEWNAATTASALIHEGRRLIEGYCGISSFDTFDAGLPAVRRLLADIPKESVSRHFHRDPASDMVFVDFRRIKGHSREAVFSELKSRHPESLLYRDHQIAVPAEPLTDLLTAFYGEVQIFIKGQEHDSVPAKRVASAIRPA